MLAVTSLLLANGTLAGRCRPPPAPWGSVGRGVSVARARCQRRKARSSCCLKATERERTAARIQTAEVPPCEFGVVSELTKRGAPPALRG
jgi:hypothetical protein